MQEKRDDCRPKAIDGGSEECVERFRARWVIPNERSRAVADAERD